MNPATTTSFQAVARNEYLDRLIAVSSEPDGFWEAVNAEVQAQLAALEADVCRAMPGVHVTRNYTAGKHFLLFSYCTFTAPESQADPIVAGVTFTPSHAGVTVLADVSGEQTGDCIYSVPTRTVGHEDVPAAARECARSLGASAPAILSALADPSRIVE